MTLPESAHASSGLNGHTVFDVRGGAAQCSALPDSWTMSCLGLVPSIQLITIVCLLPVFTHRYTHAADGLGREFTRIAANNLHFPFLSNQSAGHSSSGRITQVAVPLRFSLRVCLNGVGGTDPIPRKITEPIRNPGSRLRAHVWSSRQ